MEFRIEQWRAWAPELDNDEAWRAWSAQPSMPADSDAQPSCDFLPALQRRRLSRLARMTMHVGWPLCGEHEQLPFVFASRHGETSRTFALLGDVADGQPLSPTQFGLSVHNAIAGQWSILRGQRSESVAIAGEADTFEHAMLEAAALLGDGATAVLVVIAEEQPPAAYDGWIDDVPFSYALALRVTPYLANDQVSGSAWRLSLQRSEESAPQKSTLPHALEFVRALQMPAPFMHTWKSRQWLWQPLP